MPAPSSPRAPPACTPSQAIVLVMLMLIAMCAGVALRVYGEAAASLPRVLYHRALAGGSLGGSGIGGGESCSLPLWRASSQLNISRWQYANVSRSVFPDGSPIRHFDSPNANVWPLAESQVRVRAQEVTIASLSCFFFVPPPPFSFFHSQLSLARPRSPGNRKLSRSFGACFCLLAARGWRRGPSRLAATRLDRARSRCLMWVAGLA